jgi:hypothetical protein
MSQTKQYNAPFTARHPCREDYRSHSLDFQTEGLPTFATRVWLNPACEADFPPATLQEVLASPDLRHLFLSCRSRLPSHERRLTIVRRLQCWVIRSVTWTCASGLWQQCWLFRQVAQYVRYHANPTALRLPRLQALAEWQRRPRLMFTDEAYA